MRTERDRSALSFRSLWRRPALVFGSVLALALAHLAFKGPAAYAVTRWPSTRPVYQVVFAYTPPVPAFPKSEPVRLYRRYLHWWCELGLKHSGRVWRSHFNDPNRTSIPK